MSQNPNLEQLLDKSVLTPFVMVMGDFAESFADPDVAWAYVHLCNKPQNFKIYNQYIANHFGWGLQKAKQVMARMRKYGLTKRLIKRDSFGQYVSRTLQLQPTSNLSDYKYVRKNRNVDQEKFSFSKNNNEINAIEEDTSTGMKSHPQVTLSASKSSPLTKKISKTKKEKLTKKKISSSTDVEVAFASFWAAYPRKVGGIEEAFRIFRRDKCIDKLPEILADLARRKADPETWTEMKFIPYPSKYLDKKYYNDEASNEIINGEKVDAITNPAELREELNQLNEKIIKLNEKETDLGNFHTVKDTKARYDQQVEWGKTKSMVESLKNRREEVLKMLRKQNPSPATPRSGENRPDGRV